MFDLDYDFILTHIDFNEGRRSYKYMFKEKIDVYCRTSDPVEYGSCVGVYVKRDT